MSTLIFFTSLPPSLTLSQGGCFINHGNHPACPLGGISVLTSLQGMGDRGASVALTLADIRAQGSRLANADSPNHGAKVTLSVIVGSENLPHELLTFCYILTGLFDYA